MKNFGRGPYIILEVSFKSELNYKLHEKLQRVKISIISMVKTPIANILFNTELLLRAGRR